MLHNYPERKAFSPGRESFAAIQAKQPHSPHEGGFFGLDGVENGLYRGVGVEKQGHIADHGGGLGGHRRARKGGRPPRPPPQPEEHRTPPEPVCLPPTPVAAAAPSR